LKACTPLKGLTPKWRAGSEGIAFLGGPFLAMYKSSTCICLPNSHQVPTYIPYQLTYDAHPLT
jgi:hypothetical protein